MSDTTQASKTYHRSDYARAASMVRHMRHVKGNRYLARGDADMAKVDALAAALTSAFETDALDAGADFNPEIFLASTQLPEPPQFTTVEDDDEDDEDPDAE